MCDSSSKMEARVLISSRNKTTNKDKKMKRKEILEKKKAVDEIIRSASTGGKDALSFYPPYRHYHKNGLHLYLDSGRGDKLSSHLKLYIQSLLKLNMEGPYGTEWPTEEKVKRKEMVSPEARYIFVCEPANEQTDQITGLDEKLHPRVQGKGLGRFLMQLTELIALKTCMSAVVLTVQKANSSALNFYTSKLRYGISAISPSRVDPLSGLDKSYEILCKTFNHEAKAVLEESG